MKHIALLAVVLSTVVSAQEIPPPPPPMPEASLVNEVPPPPPDRPVDEGGRLRWGVSGNLGWHFPTSAFTFGVEGRVGWQLSRMFSVYGTLGGTLGFGFGVSVSNGGNTVTGSVTALSYGYLGAIAEGYFGDIFYVGAGPVLAHGSIVTSIIGASSNGGSQVVDVISTGFKPGIDVRFGLGLGRARPGTFRRGGFNIGIDVLTLLHPNSLLAITNADGSTVNTTGLTASVVPMLTLGYDAR